MMEQQDKLKLTSKYMIMGVLFCFTFFLVLGIIVIQFFYEFEAMPAYILGLSLSTLFSAIRIILMRRSIEKSTDQESTKSAKNAFQIGFIVRQFLIIGYLVLVFVFNEYIGLVGALIGMFFVKVSGYIGNSLLTKHEKSSKE